MLKSSQYFAALIFSCVTQIPVHQALARDSDTQPQPATVPAALSAYVHEGRFDPGDFAWAKGYFPGDPEAEKAEYVHVMNWLESCSQGEVEGVQAALSDMG